MAGKDKVYITLEVIDKGKAVIRGFDKDTEQAFDRMKRNAKASTASMGSSLQKLKSHWMAVTAAMAGVVLIARKFINAASDLQEVNSKFNVVFEDQIDLAEKWAQQLVDSYAMSTREAKQYLSSIQDLLVPMGMAADSAGKMSIEVVKLSADLGSFNNLPTAQVMADIQSGLVGNYETMKKYGVVLNATVVQEKALAMGLAATKSELTAAHKAHAAYTLMVEGSQAAVGDMERTSGGFANQMKAVKARMEEVAATIATPLLPALADLLGALTEIAKYWTKAFKGPEPVDYAAEMLEDWRKELKESQEDLLHYTKILETPGMSKWIPGYLDKVRAWREETIKNIAMVEAKIAFVTQPRAQEPELPLLEDATPKIETPELDWKAYMDAKKEEFALLKTEQQSAHDFALLLAQDEVDKRIEQMEFMEALEEKIHQEDMARIDEVMKANEQYMKQYEANEKAKAALAKQAARDALASWSSVFKDLAKGSKTAFDLWKATAIAQTIIDTYVAAQAAFKAMAGIPVVGPALAVAAAAAAIAAGMARVSAIKSQEAGEMYHGGGIVGRGSRPSRRVSPDVFAGAQRAHTGLAPDERPVIVRKDEGIFTPEQMAALGMGEDIDNKLELHIDLYMDGRPMMKNMIHTVEVDSIMLNRLRRALS